MTKPKTQATTALQTLADATAPGKTPSASKTQAKPKAQAKTPVDKPAKTVTAKPEGAQYMKVQGTAKELIDKGININGKPLDSVALSILAKHSVIKVVGYESRPEGSRGRAGAIFEIQGKSGFKVEAIKPTKVKQETQAQPQTDAPKVDSPATPLEALQTAVGAPMDGVQVVVLPSNRIPVGFQHAQAMGLA